MIFTKEECNKIYNKLYGWLSSISAGGRCYQSTLNHYQTELWQPLIDKIDELSLKQPALLTYEESTFLATVVHNGPIYRVHSHRIRKKSHICETNCFQSWSKSIEAVSYVKFSNNDLLLLVGEAVNGVNVNNLLRFLYFFYKKDLIFGYYCHDEESNEDYKISANISELFRYEKEEEIALLMSLQYIKCVVAIKREDILSWESLGEPIPIEKWKRKKI